MINMREGHITRTGRPGRPRKNARDARLLVERVQPPDHWSLNNNDSVMVDSPSSLSDTQLSVDSGASQNVSSGKTDDSGGEICAFCNCGSEMALVLGQLTQYAVSCTVLKKSDINTEKLDAISMKENSEVNSSTDIKPIQLERMYHKRRRQRSDVETGLNMSQDMISFGTASMQDFPEVLDNHNCLWAHHCCAAWSTGVCQTDSYDLENVDRAVVKSLVKKCSHCDRYGASVECQVHKCNKVFHYPCCASAGAFQDIKSMVLLCPDHLDRAEKLADAEAFCDVCEKTENLSSQLFCTSCGRHFHSYCLQISINITPVVRLGWQCSYCKVCQGCKQPGDDDKMLCCDNCDKGYHTYCLTPPITTVPKAAWKCEHCRMCKDCGSRRAGGGPSCRWHDNYTLCDRCYQQRKKGQCCLLCGRAVRLYSNEQILQCKRCFKYFHGDCDGDFSKSGGDAQHYTCSECVNVKLEDCSNSIDRIYGEIVLDQNEDSISSFTEYDLAATGQRTVTIEEARKISMMACSEFLKGSPLRRDPNSFDDVKNGLLLDDICIDSEINSVSEITPADYDDSKEDSDSALGSPRSCAYDDPVCDDGISSTLYRLPHPGRPPGMRGRKRLSKFKSAHPLRGRKLHGRGRIGCGRGRVLGMSSPSSLIESKENDDLYDSSNLADDIKKGEEDDEDSETEGLHSTVVVVSTKDRFTLEQDICMCCGSFGKDSEGYLIGCAQCGQCFHPYCVNLKVNKVILTRGWRCLDCTVCEGCGKNEDEAHLLLCDNCDISFHTYCLQPPLMDVPEGGWKCKWCVMCEDCGATTPGLNCSWMSNFTQCGPCASDQYCTICSYAYEANQLIIRCEYCHRWLHAECDGLNSEQDAENACSVTYHCSMCRPVTKHLGIYSSFKGSVISKAQIRKINTQRLLPENSISAVLAKNARKTKTLHDLRAKRLAKAAMKEERKKEKERQPLYPVQNVITDEFGTFKIDLELLKSRLRREDIIKANYQLTDAGLKEIKGQVIRAPVKKSEKPVKKRDLLTKFDTSEVKTSALTTDENSCTVDGHEDNRQPVCMDTSMDLENLGLENDVMSPDSFSIKKEEVVDENQDGDGMESVEITSEINQDITGNAIDESQEELAGGPDVEDINDPFEFFGCFLLEDHFNEELETLSGVRAKKRLKKDRKKERRLKRALRAEAAESSFELLAAPFVSDPTAVCSNMAPGPSVTCQSPVCAIEASKVASVPVLQPPTSTDMVSSTELLTTVCDSSTTVRLDPHAPNALSTGVEPQVGRTHLVTELLHFPDKPRVSGSCVEKRAESAGASCSPPPAPPIIPTSTGCSTANSVSDEMVSDCHYQEVAGVDSSSHMDLMGISDLPHVEGHEVEQIFAGLERETIVDHSTHPHVHGQDFLETVYRSKQSFSRSQSFSKQDDNFVAPAYVDSSDDSKPIKASLGENGDAYRNLSTSRVNLSHAGLPQHSNSDRPVPSTVGVVPSSSYRDNVPFIHPHHQLQQKSSQGSEDADAFRAVFGEDPEWPEHSQSGAVSPKANGQKQLKKWQQDELLGENATISPVLYANMCHKNLANEFKDWPSRARAIAKLWRKLPTEQREPFRLQARDNRVKQKDQGKKNRSTTSKEPCTPDSELISPEPRTPLFSNADLVYPPFASGSADQKSPSCSLPAASSSESLHACSQQQQVIQFTRSPPQTGPSKRKSPPTILTVPEPQKLSPLLNDLSPPFSVSSFSGFTPTSPLTPKLLPPTPTTPSFHSVVPVLASNLKSKCKQGNKTKVPKTKEPKDDKTLDKPKKKKRSQETQEKEKQWKVLQQQRLAEQQRNNFLKQYGAAAGSVGIPAYAEDMSYPSILREAAVRHLQSVEMQSALPVGLAPGNNSISSFMPSPATSSNFSMTNIISDGKVPHRPSTLPGAASHSSLQLLGREHPFAQLQLGLYPASKDEQSLSNSGLQSAHDGKQKLAPAMLPAVRSSSESPFNTGGLLKQTEPDIRSRSQSSPYRSASAQDSDTTDDSMLADSTFLQRDRVKPHTLFDDKESGASMETLSLKGEQATKEDAFLREISSVSDSAAKLMPSQQQAYLLQQQQQQYMAAQQHYIQWQLTQQSSVGVGAPPAVVAAAAVASASSALGGLAAETNFPVAIPSAPSTNDKGLPEVNSEEQHQERIRFLYQQRQYHKEQSTYVKQPSVSRPPTPPPALKTNSKATAVRSVPPAPTPSPVPGASANTAAPVVPAQADLALQQYMAVCQQQAAMFSEPFQRQVMAEYMMRQRQRQEQLGQVGGPEKFMMELAQQYNSRHPMAFAYWQMMNQPRLAFRGPFPPNMRAGHSLYGAAPPFLAGIPPGVLETDKGKELYLAHIQQQHRAMLEAMQRPVISQKDVLGQDAAAVLKGMVGGPGEETGSLMSSGERNRADSTYGSIQASSAMFPTVAANYLAVGAMVTSADPITGRSRSDVMYAGAGFSGPPSTYSPSISVSVPRDTPYDGDSSHTGSQNNMNDSFDEDIADSSIGSMKIPCLDGVHGVSDEDDLVVPSRVLNTSGPLASTSDCENDGSDHRTLVSSRVWYGSASSHSAGGPGSNSDAQNMYSSQERLFDNTEAARRLVRSVNSDVVSEGAFRSDLAVGKSFASAETRPVSCLSQSPVFARPSVTTQSAACAPGRISPASGSADAFLSGFASKVESDAKVQSAMFDNGSKSGKTAEMNALANVFSSFGKDIPLSGNDVFKEENGTPPGGETQFNFDVSVVSSGSWPNMQGQLNDGRQNIMSPGISDFNRQQADNNLNRPSVTSVDPLLSLYPTSYAGVFDAPAVGQQSQPANTKTTQQPKLIALHPGSPRYHQIFIYQHQLLIMQFQQYQFQLQLQFQQLSQQQMSPQQQFLLHQQFQQQMLLLQQQFMQQQTQLHRMAANGIQFTEQQLNAMYRQQMLTQQAYRQWVAALPPEQQMVLQSRMQASMQQVQHQMAQIMTQTVRVEEEPKKTKPKARRQRKPKTASATAPAAVESPLPPTPQTPQADSTQSRPGSQMSNSSTDNIASSTSASSRPPSAQSQLSTPHKAPFSPRESPVSVHKSSMSAPSMHGASAMSHVEPRTSLEVASLTNSISNLKSEDLDVRGNVTPPTSIPQSASAASYHQFTMWQHQQLLLQHQAASEGRVSAPSLMPVAREICVPVSTNPATIQKAVLPHDLHVKSNTSAEFGDPFSSRYDPVSIGAIRAKVIEPGLIQPPAVRPQPQPQFSVPRPQASIAPAVRYTQTQTLVKSPIIMPVSTSVGVKDRPANDLVTTVLNSKPSSISLGSSMFGRVSDSSSSSQEASVLSDATPSSSLTYTSFTSNIHGETPSLRTQTNPSRVTVAGVQRMVPHTSLSEKVSSPSLDSHSRMRLSVSDDGSHPAAPKFSVSSLLSGSPSKSHGLTSPTSSLASPPLFSPDFGHKSDTQLNSDPMFSAPIRMGLVSSALAGNQHQNQPMKVTSLGPGGGTAIIPPTPVSKNASQLHIDAAKSVLQKPLKEKKPKKVDPKKIERDLERQKRKEEKLKQKQLREEKKQERMQQKMLKAKAAQEAKILAQEAKAVAAKKKQKVLTLAAAVNQVVQVPRTELPVPVPTPDPTPVASAFPSPVAPKIPLCEPEVHLLYPLVQPYGFTDGNGENELSGSFGFAVLDGGDDPYCSEKIDNFATELVPLDTVEHPVSGSAMDPSILDDSFLLGGGACNGASGDEEDADTSENGGGRDSLTAGHEDLTEMKPSTTLSAGDQLGSYESTLRDFCDDRSDYEPKTIACCNQCHGSLQQVVFYVDKRMETVSEEVFDEDKLIISEKLAFCCGRCVEEFRQKTDIAGVPDLDDDFGELVDAAKAVTVVATSEDMVTSSQMGPRGGEYAAGLTPLQRMRLKKRGIDPSSDHGTVKKARKLTWKRWRFIINVKRKPKLELTEDDINELMRQYDVRLKPGNDVVDQRMCMLCGLACDGPSEGCSRLLNFDVDTWVHLNCALWSTEVYEALNGGLHNVEKAFMRSTHTYCSLCLKVGATINCSQMLGPQQRVRCDKVYHFNCAVQAQCVFYKDKTILCAQHKMFGVADEELSSQAVRRKVYIDRNVTKQIAKMLHLNNELECKEYTFRVGNIVYHEVGHVPSYVLENFSTQEAVFPIDFATTCIYWDSCDASMRKPYCCSIADCGGRPEFSVKVLQDGSHTKECKAPSAKGAWDEILERVRVVREERNLLKVFPEFITGEHLFGMSEPVIQRLIESLPGVETIPNFNFRFGRTPLLIAELPLAINLSGCMRSEKVRKLHSTRPLSLRTASEYPEPIVDESWLTYTQRAVQISVTKAAQYRRMRQEWRANVLLGRSRIQGLGLFAKRDIEVNTFIIEYIGSLIRNEVANRLEALYERQNRGIYMFRIDNDVVVDATMTGGPARYINHSCDPNCVAEIVSIEREKKIIIISNRKIEQGEELTYDYKFEFEDDSAKIPCLCGSANCRKWMN